MAAYTATPLATADGARLLLHQWLPAVAPRGLVLIVHGIGEHGLRYDHVARAMAAAGYAVFAPDQRGHGRSSGLRTHFASFDEPVRDLATIQQRLAAEYGGLALFVYGHSMGSGIALLYALRHQHDLRGLILSGTVTNIADGQNPLLVRAGRWMARVLPRARLVRGLASSALTTDPDMLRQYEADTLIDRQPMRIGMVAGMIDLGRYLRAHAHRLTLPLLILHGEDDAITPISGSRAVFACVNSRDKTLRTFPGLRHELVNEVGREAIIQGIIDWLNKH